MACDIVLSYFTGRIRIVRRWTAYFIYTVISVIVLSALINYLGNPYNVFGYDDQNPRNCIKKHVISDRMTKVYTLKERRPKTILVGTSRIGMFPENAFEPFFSKPVMNFALVGSTITEQADYISFAIQNAPIHTVIWSMDLFSFNPTKPLHPDFHPDRLIKDIYWQDIQYSLFSFTTLKNTLLTFRDNYHLKNAAACRYEHQKEETSLLGQPFDAGQIDYNINYTLDEYANSKSFLKSVPFRKPSSLDRGLEKINEILMLCRSRNIDILIYTSPVYVKHIELYKQTGLYNTYLYWKASLAAMTPLVDFANINEITVNPENFRDSSHIIGDFGSVIASRLANVQTSGQTGFGRLIAPRASKNLMKEKGALTGTKHDPMIKKLYNFKNNHKAY